MSGYEVKKSIASRDEVAMKQDDNPSPELTPTPAQPQVGARKASAKQLAFISRVYKESGKEESEFLNYCYENFNITSAENLLMDDVDQLLTWLRGDQ